MKRFLRIVAFLCTVYLLFVGCSNGVSDDSSTSSSSSSVSTNSPVAANKTIHNMSSVLSEYMSSVEKRLGCRYWGTSSSGPQIPDILVVNGRDTAGITEELIVTVLRVCMQGKTLVIDSPSPFYLSLFGLGCSKVLDESLEKVLTYNCVAGTQNIKDFMKNLENLSNDLYDVSLGSNYYQQKAYQAIAFRKREIYFAQKIDERIPTRAIDELGNYDSLNLGTDQEFPKEQYEKLFSDSVEYFAEWIGEKNDAGKATDSRALLQANSGEEDARAFVEAQANGEIQSWYNNFPATVKLTASAKAKLDYFIREHNNFCSKIKAPYSYSSTDQKDAETVDYIVNVWAKSCIETQTDYYLVKISVTCNNMQLSGGKMWADKFFSSKALHDAIRNNEIKAFVPTYFKACEIKTYIDKTKQKIYSNYSTPQNEIGSVTYTKGGSYTISGGLSVGYSKQGLAGGANAGFSRTYSWSTSDTVPGIDIYYGTTGADSNESVLWIFKNTEVQEEAYYKTQTFDTVSLFSLPSSYSSSDNSEYVDLTVGINVTLGINKYYTETPIVKTFKVKKPSNAYSVYNMSFENKDKVLDPTALAALKKQLEDFCRIDEKTQLWYSTADYYAVLCGEEFNDTDKRKQKFDSVAKEHFQLVKNKIENSKSLFLNAGFTGNYNFKVQTSDTDVVDQFAVNFIH